MSKYQNFESSRFVLGLSLTMYGVTASRAKKKAGLNQAHKPGGPGAFARSPTSLCSSKGHRLGPLGFNNAIERREKSRVKVLDGYGICGGSA